MGDGKRNRDRAYGPVFRYGDIAVECDLIPGKTSACIIHNATESKNAGLFPVEDVAFIAGNLPSQ